MTYEERSLTPAEAETLISQYAKQYETVLMPLGTWKVLASYTMWLLIIPGIVATCTAALLGSGSPIPYRVTWIIGGFVGCLTAIRLVVGNRTFLRRERHEFEVLRNQLQSRAAVRTYIFEIRRFWNVFETWEKGGPALLLESGSGPVSEYVYIGADSPAVAGLLPSPPKSLKVHVVEPPGVILAITGVGDLIDSAGSLPEENIWGQPDGRPREFQLMPRHELPSEWQRHVARTPPAAH